MRKPPQAAATGRSNCVATNLVCAVLTDSRSVLELIEQTHQKQRHSISNSNSMLCHPVQYPLAVVAKFVKLK